MNNWFFFALVSVVPLVGCASLDEALVSQGVKLDSKQEDYRKDQERITKNVSLSNDRYDSFRGLSVSNQSGILISVPVDAAGNGAYVTQKNGARLLPISFDCDYTKGVTQGDMILRSQSPRNMYEGVYTKINVTCTPLTDDEKAKKIADEAEALRLAAAQKKAKEEAETKRIESEKEAAKIAAARERQQKADDAKELAYRASPQYKREAAAKEIVRLRAQIQAANQSMDDERQIGAVSGYVNATRLHGLGALILDSQRQMDRQWAIYKSNGGSVDSIDAVK